MCDGSDPIQCIRCGAVSYNEPGKTPITCKTCWESLQSVLTEARRDCLAFEQQARSFNQQCCALTTQLLREANQVKQELFRLEFEIKIKKENATKDTEK